MSTFGLVCGGPRDWQEMSIAESHMYTTLTYPLDAMQIYEVKDAAVMAVDTCLVNMIDTVADVDSGALQRAVELQGMPFFSLFTRIGKSCQVSLRCRRITYVPMSLQS